MTVAALKRRGAAGRFVYVGGIELLLVAKETDSGVVVVCVTPPFPRERTLDDKTIAYVFPKRCHAYFRSQHKARLAEISSNYPLEKIKEL